MNHVDMIKVWFSIMPLDVFLYDLIFCHPQKVVQVCILFLQIYLRTQLLFVLKSLATKFGFINLSSASNKCERNE